MPGQALDQRSVLNGQTVEYTTRAPVKVHRILSAATINATPVQSAGAQLHGFCVCNVNAAPRYLKIYDVNGTPVPASHNFFLKLVILIPPTNGSVNLAFDAPIVFTNGLGYALVTGISDTDATAVGAGDVALSIFYT